MQNLFKHPAKVRRNLSVEKAKTSFEQYAIWPEVAGVSSSGGGVWVAGRIIGILDGGFVLQDESSRMDLEFAEKVNAGDIVEVLLGREERVAEGGKKVMVFLAKEVKVLTPCATDFFVGKSSPNYLKAVIDLKFRENLKKRMMVVDKIRKFFSNEGFLEVETPQMVRLPGMEPYLDVFKTGFTGWNRAEGGVAEPVAEDMYLITSPEYAMKKLLVAGFEKIFQICRSFRNKENLSELHNPEFTILEWYRAYSSYEEIMDDTERLVLWLAQEVSASADLTFNGHNVNLFAPWPRVKVKDLFKDLAGIPYEEFEDPGKFREAVLRKGYKVGKDAPYEDLFFVVFLNEIEPRLGLEKPVIVYEYPVQMAALSRKCEDDPRYAERFEVYVAGVEICNAFSELNDYVEQGRRLEEERKERAKLGKADYPVDQSFVSALQFGMPPSGGIALGVDRLAMLLTGTGDINDIIFFPFKDL